MRGIHPSTPKDTIQRECRTHFIRWKYTGCGFRRVLARFCAQCCVVTRKYTTRRRDVERLREFETDSLCQVSYRCRHSLGAETVLANHWCQLDSDKSRKRGFSRVPSHPGYCCATACGPRRSRAPTPV
jgi:hypothetical protein